MNCTGGAQGPNGSKRAGSVAPMRSRWSAGSRRRAILSSSGASEMTRVSFERVTPNNLTAPPAELRAKGPVGVTKEELGLRHVLFVNDVAFISETIASAMPSFGFHAKIVGWRAKDGPRRRSNFIRTSSRLLRRFADFQEVDLVHVNYGLFGYAALMAPGKPTVLHLHGSEIRPADSARGRIARASSRWFSRYCSAVWYSTTDLKDVVRQAGLLGRFMPSPVADFFFTATPQVPPKPHVLFAIPLSRSKGAELAIEAMQVLADGTPNCRMSAFGFGISDEEAVALRRRIPSSVRLLSWTPHQAMPQLLAEATIIVGQLGLGALGITELEAMALRRPVVARLGKPLPEVEPYYARDPPVLSCESGERVAQTVLDLLQDSARMERLGEDGRTWVQEYHSAQTVAKLYADEYRKLL